MNVEQAIILLGALFAATLAVAALIYRPRSVPQWSFLVAIGLLATEGFFQLFSVNALSQSETLFWQRAALLPLSGMPLAWLLFSLTYARGNAKQFLKQWTPGLIVGGGLPLLLGVIFWRSGVVNVEAPEVGSGYWRFPVSLMGSVLHLSVVICSALVLANLEWTFRSAIGTARWKVKYAVFGLVLWCGARIYTSCQVVAYSANSSNLILLNAAALLLTSVFFSVALYRAKLSHVDIYPSPTALHRSITFVLAGAYLIIVGLLAKFVSLKGGQGFPLTALVVLVGLSGLGIFSLSDRVRNSTRQFISRHFKRPSYDYRQVWMKFTQRTVAVLDREEYSRRMVAVISETFETLSVTIWLADSGNRRFVFGASTSLDSRDAALAPVADAVYEDLSTVSADTIEPVDLDRSTEKWCARLKESNPEWFPKAGGHRICVPLVFGRELAGLLVLGDRVRGAPFTPEDFELLKCLGDQMAAGLRTLNLSEKLVRAKEMEAFQVMSAFLVHDLKNTASALSLTLRNLPVHFENPAFREDALRTLSRSVQRVNELIGRLSTLRQKLELRRQKLDLNQLVATALQSVGEQPQITMVQNCQPLALLSLDPVQMESVIVNLLLNAREAIKGTGEIRIETGAAGGHAQLTVSDNGCGMTPEFMANSLFKPFKTSKKTGLGIGMYQTKTVVDAHGGRISVDSVIGKGTTFRVLLPLEQNLEKSE